MSIFQTEWFANRCLNVVPPSALDWTVWWVHSAFACCVLFGSLTVNLPLQEFSSLCCLESLLIGESFPTNNIGGLVASLQATARYLACLQMMINVIFTTCGWLISPTIGYCCPHDWRLMIELVVIFFSGSNSYSELPNQLTVGESIRLLGYRKTTAFLEYVLLITLSL